jgi:N6-L-threonylcarbamoyladenine synthase
MIILGIETSCDETSLCIMKNGEILSLKTYSQIELHSRYGGVVPEIASRDHLEKLPILTKQVFEEANIAYNEVDLISCTDRPGLIGSLLTGVMFAKGLSIAINKPIIFADHLLSHVFTCNVTHNLKENFICLLVSGGHSAIYDVNDINSYTIIGQTIDDSFGEVFDKISKSLGFGYPGGAIVENLAMFGDETTYKFPIPLKGKNLYNFSLSGIKTEFVKLIQKSIEKWNVPRGTSFEEVYENLYFNRNQHLDGFSSDVANICASFQSLVLKIIQDRLNNALKSVRKHENFVLCGGVASNKYIRKGLQHFCLQNCLNFYVPDTHLCTDNAAMIANYGALMFEYSEK